MMSSVTWVKFIKTKAIFRYHTKSVSNQVLSNSDHQIKSYSCSNSSTKIGKHEKVEKKLWVTKPGNKVITNRSRFQGLQIGARGITNCLVLGILNWGKKITNRGMDFKLEQRDFKLGQRLQIGARKISNRGRDYKSGLGLQIGAEQVLQVLEQWLFVSTFME